VPHLRARRRALASGLLAAVAFLFATGHGGDDDGGCGHSDEGEVLGPLTGASCPPTSTLTYESFGRAFMGDYCVRCHDSKLTGAARQGATSFHDFDTVAGIRGVGDHIERTAGAGPGAINETMPPNGAKPSLEDRQKLAEWMVCGAP
jgi:cytochrome c5